MIIFLCGFIGCGKSTVGEKFSEKYQYEFLDLDKRIEDKAGMKISDIFKLKGEKYFRELETKELEEIKGENIVVSTGGGAIISQDNSKIAREKGKVIYIKVPFEICYDRIKNSNTRPLAKSKDQLKALYDEREPIYNAHCDISIKGEANPIEIASDLFGMLHK